MSKSKKRRRGAPNEPNPYRQARAEAQKRREAEQVKASQELPKAPPKQKPTVLTVVGAVLVVVALVMSCIAPLAFAGFWVSIVAVVVAVANIPAPKKVTSPLKWRLGVLAAALLSVLFTAMSVDWSAVTW